MKNRSTIKPWRERITPASNMGEQLVAMQAQTDELVEALEGEQDRNVRLDADWKRCIKENHELREALKVAQQCFDEVVCQRDAAERDALQSNAERVPLSDEQISIAYESATGYYLTPRLDVSQHLDRQGNLAFARAIEAKITKG